MTVSEGQLSLLPEGGDQGGATLHGTQTVARAVFELPETAGTEVGQFVMLQLTPDVLGGVEFRGVRGQILQLVAPLRLST